MDDERFVIGSAARLACAVGLAVLSGALVTLAHRLDWGGEWGIAWIALVPAATLLIPAFGLARRIVLMREADTLVVEVGWLMRRAWRLRLEALELEVVPTAGLRALIAHKGPREYPLAVWLPPARAELLAAWLDRAAPGGRWPRRVTRMPRGDR
ncbi:MAG TPA: hypothetical protein VEL07_10615 [Planctomycetota bacterium]|nr:hypothetical protein [Planctomycetota bacterium]